MRVKINAFEIGKHRIKKGNHHINTMIYRDYEGTFLMCKGNRINVKDKVEKKKRVFYAEWEV